METAQIYNVCSNIQTKQLEWVCNAISQVSQPAWKIAGICRKTSTKF